MRFDLFANSESFENYIKIIATIVSPHNKGRKMTESEELFAKYYNSEIVLVADMDDQQLREHREELRQIATEAKARLMASDDSIRERNAKKNPKQKDWSVPVDHSQVTSDAINAVETRKKRMNKIEKLQEQWSKYLPDDVVKQMVRDVEKTMTEKTMKTITFTAKTEETKAVQVEVKETEKKEPFDPSKLFGKKD